MDCEQGNLRVNLLLNGASQWADVYSHIPSEGKVTIKIKNSLSDVSVRMPEWIESDSSEVKGTVNNVERPVLWNGRYISAGPVASGDIVNVYFPIIERTVRERIAEKTYTLLIKGNTVLSMEPPGRYCPQYQSRRHKARQLVWRPATRFVGTHSLDN